MTDVLEQGLQNYVYNYPSHLQQIAKYLNDGANVDCQNYGQFVADWTPLMLSVHKNYSDLTKLLISRGAEVNKVYPSHTAKDYTPLAWAIHNGYEAIATYLIMDGANVNKGVEDKTPLTVAVRKNNIKMVEFLLDNGAIYTSHTALLEAIDTDSLEIFQMLLERGAKVDFVYQGHTPLTRILQRGNSQMAQELLKKDLDVNLANEEGKLPINMCIDCGNLDFVKLFIEKGASLKVKDNNGDSPLSKALRRQRFKIVKYLVDEAGAAVHPTDEDEENPLMIAASNLDFLSFQLLIEHGANVNLILDKLQEVASSNKNFDIFLKTILTKNEKRGSGEGAQEDAST